MVENKIIRLGETKFSPVNISSKLSNASACLLRDFISTNKIQFQIISLFQFFLTKETEAHKHVLSLWYILPKGWESLEPRLVEPQIESRSVRWQIALAKTEHRIEICVTCILCVNIFGSDNASERIKRRAHFYGCENYSENVIPCSGRKAESSVNPRFFREIQRI